MDELEPLLGEHNQAPKTFDQLIGAVNVAGGKKYTWRNPFKRRAAAKELRAAIDALKARWMRSDRNPFEVSGREAQDFQAFLNVMEQHFPQKDILDVLNYKKGGILNYYHFRAFARLHRLKIEANHPNILSAAQQLEFDIREDTVGELVVQKLEALLDQGLTLQSRDKNGSTILHTVLEQLNPNISDDEVREVFQFFQKHGADFNAQDGRGNTPLHIAARRRLVKLANAEVLSSDEDLLGAAQQRDVEKVISGVVKILCEEFGAIPEIANNNLAIPAVGGFGDGDLELSMPQFNYLFNRASKLHVAIEMRNVEEFKGIIKNYRRNSQPSVNSFQNNHSQLGLPIFHLQKLISDYEKQPWWKHSFTQWRRQRKLKQMMEFYLENLARKIRGDFRKLMNNSDLRADANLIAEMSVLSAENQNIVIRDMFIVYERTSANIRAVRNRYLVAIPSASIASAPVAANAGNNNNNNNVEAVIPKWLEALRELPHVGKVEYVSPLENEQSFVTKLDEIIALRKATAVDVWCDAESGFSIASELAKWIANNNARVLTDQQTLWFLKQIEEYCKFNQNYNLDNFWDTTLPNSNRTIIEQLSIWVSDKRRHLGPSTLAVQFPKLHEAIQARAKLGAQALHDAYQATARPGANAQGAAVAGNNNNNNNNAAVAPASPRVAPQSAFHAPAPSSPNSYTKIIALNANDLLAEGDELNGDLLNILKRFSESGFSIVLLNSGMISLDVGAIQRKIPSLVTLQGEDESDFSCLFKYGEALGVNISNIYTFLHYSSADLEVGLRDFARTQNITLSQSHGH